jgi:hypothetical protein
MTRFNSVRETMIDFFSLYHPIIVNMRIAKLNQTDQYLLSIFDNVQYISEK